MTVDTIVVGGVGSLLTIVGFLLRNLLARIQKDVMHMTDEICAARREQEKTNVALGKLEVWRGMHEQFHQDRKEDVDRRLGELEHRKRA